MDENKQMVIIHLINHFFSLLSLLIKVGLPMWAIVEVTGNLAGQQTLASIVVDIFGQGGDKPWEIAAGIGLGGWALVERHHRKTKTAYLTERLRKYEKLHDPDRTSSNLTATGDTNPVDE